VWGLAIFVADYKSFLGRLLSPQSVFFAVEDMYVKPGHTMNFAFGFDGKVSTSPMDSLRYDTLQSHLKWLLSSDLTYDEVTE
jgi:hypothetical protein